jgi:hypothetical protein
LRYLILSQEREQIFPLVSSDDNDNRVYTLLSDTATQIAAVLTTIEEKSHGSICPADYIFHIRNRGNHGRVAEALVTVNKITLWVMQELLAPDAVEDRGKILRIFLHTAHVGYQCFSSST